ncbi:putative helicase senataxin [Triplophysa tibetana]|uniref:Putative helicase senataxin n=1 Tax=Triplophysa tibetana TaxID=1572043 RepID=A0A5A9PDG8_9TELE|nr:putative helicase senataxin [Triplophysa tibetana]
MHQTNNARVYLLYHTWSQVIYGGLAGMVMGVVWFFITQEVLTPVFPKIAAWPVSEFFLVRDTSLIPNILWFEYTVTRSEARHAQRMMMIENCMWCTTSLDVEGGEAIRTLLRRYGLEKLSKHEMDSLNEDLSCCMDCVVEYHRARDRVTELHKVLWEMEKVRLLHVLGSMLDQELGEDDDILIIEDDHEEPVSKISPTEFLNSLRFPLFEVLKYPYLLCHPELCAMAVKALCVLQDMKQSLNVFEKYQGTYLLLVHPDEKVRRWAIDAAKTMKSVDRDAYYDLQEIFSCMLYVLELGFYQDVPDLDLDSYACGTIERLPSHLYDAHNKKNYWLGICMLLTQLSAETMDSLFMGQFNIPLCILNTMDGLKNEDDFASDPFWPALQCFMVILDRLGSKIWCQVDPIVAFQTITGAARYTAEIRNIQKKTMGGKVKVEPEYDDNMVTCSQMVYDCYASEKTSQVNFFTNSTNVYMRHKSPHSHSVLVLKVFKSVLLFTLQTSSSSSSGGICNNMIYEDMQSLVNVLDSEMGQSMRVYGSTFLWFIPFVQSIMDLPEFNASYIRQVIHYLCDKINVNRHMLNGQTNMCDKVTEFFTRILIKIVKLHFDEGRMGKLSRCAHIWVEVIVMCTVLSDELINSRPPEWMSGIHGVSSTSNTLGYRLPAPGSGVGAIIQGCNTLIRQLLQEGKRTGSDQRSTKYLNSLNKQLRGDPNKRWKLTSSESAELQRCLESIVKSMPERPASPPSAPSAPSIETAPNCSLFKNTTLRALQHEDQEAGPSREGEASTFIKEEPLWDCISDDDFFSSLEDIMEVKKEPSEPVMISERQSLPVELAHIKPDMGKLQELRSRLNDNQNLTKIEAIAQMMPGKAKAGGDHLGHEGLPVTSKRVQMAAAKEECSFGDEMKEDDDEPLDRRLVRLMKSQRNVGKKHAIGTSKENFDTIIISDDEISESGERPTNKIGMSCDDNKSPVSPESPGRDYDDLSESQVFEFETQQYVASAWEDSDFDTSVVTRKFKFDSALKAQVTPVLDEGSPSRCSETEAVPDEDIERACQQAEEKIRQQQQSEEKIRQQKQKEEKVRQRQQTEEKIRQQKQTEEKIRQQKQTEEKIRQQKQTEEKIRQQKQTEEKVQHQEQTDEKIRQQKQTEEKVQHQEQTDEKIRQQKQTEEKIRQQKQTEEKIRQQKQTEEKVQHQEQTDEKIRQQKQTEEKIRRQKQTEEKIRQQKQTEGKQQQAEENIRQQQQPQEQTVSFASSSPKLNSPVECNDKFIKPTTLPRHCAVSIKKPLIIEALAQKINRHHRKRTRGSQDDEEPHLTSESSSELHAPSTSSSSITSACFLSSTSRGIPAVVPPKKFRKAIEPETTVERLGLKKRERKAFELSQRSLDSVAKLRGHGQKVQVEQQQIRRRVSATKTSPQKRMGKGNKKLLASQDMQFFRQSRDKRQRPAVMSPTTPAPKPTTSTQPGDMHPLKPMVREKDFAYLPCPQPDLDSPQNNECTATEIKSNHTNENCDTDSRSAVFEHNRTESEYLGSGEFADVAVNKKGKKDAEDAKEEVDDEWMFLTQMEPTDMELCSQMEQLEENDERFFLTQRDPVDMDLDMDDEVDKSDTTVQQEMEKGDKPPPVWNTFKAKVVRPPSAMPPPAMPPQKTTSPQFAHPMPLRPVSRPQSHAPKSITSTKISSTSEPPSYKTYPRPEAPVHRPPRTMDQSPNFDTSFLTQAILDWEYRMFENYKAFGSPDDLCQHPLKEVPVKFTSYQEYFYTMYPLLLVNAFEEMAKEWQKKGRITLFAKIQGMEYSNRIASTNFIAGLNTNEEMKQLYPKEDDLVLLWLPENTGAYKHDGDDVLEHAHFGYVSRSNISNRVPGTNSTLNMTIQTRGNVSSVNAQLVRCEVIGSLVSTFREFRALCLLRNGTMLRPLLTSHVSYFTHSRDIQMKMETPEYNVDQSRAIACGLAMIKSTQKTPKFLLLHGPPGTGKSKTIGGLLHKLLSSVGNGAAPVGSLSSKARRTRILLCAPSNAAIDSLMKKVIVVFKEKCRNINIPQERVQQTVEADIQTQKEQLDHSIDILSQHYAKVKKDTPECRSKRQESQALVLQNAHVICCTLSTSGSIILENAFRRLGHEPFCCVIIDEASQAKETETLIPMLYRCPAVILVGDPNQLPPTVVSLKAKELGYDQSLMARLYKSLHQSNPQPSPVFLLSMQYRMHPDICEFPSKYIYNNMLKSDWQGQCRQYEKEESALTRAELGLMRFLSGPCKCETAQKRCSYSWPFKPYRVFDVTDGRENKERDSYFNIKEVKLVVMLLKLLGEKPSVRVGVITHYNAQKQKILEALRESSSQIKQLQVEVDTVDGFQGREMDCVIVSCVRASSEMGSIGFVGNRQRMNVTITRAKFSLFILGHLRTLKEQSDWGALIEDAGRRGTVIKTRERDFCNDAKKILKRETPSRSLSHPPVNRPTAVIPPANHALMETGSTSTSRPHVSSGPSRQQQQPSPKLIPLDWPRDPRICVTDRPTDPRFAEWRPEQMQDIERRSSSVSRQSEQRDFSNDVDHRNTGHSDRYHSQHDRSSSHRR